MRRSIWSGVSIILVSASYFACSGEDGGVAENSVGGSGAFAQGGSSASTGSGGGFGAMGGSGAGADSGLGGNAASGSGGSAGSGSGGSAASDSKDSGPPDVVFTYDAPVEEEDACAATSAKAEPLPLDMYVMLDRSGSMGTDCNVGQTTASKWCRAINALHGYFADSSSTGNGVALQYFPINSYSCTGNGGACATPAVPLANLPGNLTTLTNSLNGTVPNGSNTPMEAGLRGLVSYTGNNQRAGRIMVGILITDGNPNGCTSSATTLNSIIANHFNSTGIRTFVIGMDGATFSTLETIANGGGADPHTNYCGAGSTCHHYSVGNGDPNVFIAALKDIQQQALGCEYQVPTPTGGIIDYSKVKVIYTPGSGGPQELPQVPTAGQCSGPGWYYDDLNNPTKITLCPNSCDSIKADQNASVDIELPCLGS